MNVAHHLAEVARHADYLRERQRLGRFEVPSMLEYLVHSSRYIPLHNTAIQGRQGPSLQIQATTSDTVITIFQKLQRHGAPTRKRSHTRTTVSGILRFHRKRYTPLG